MSTRIRLRRMGSKGRPFYRVVVADQRAPRDGRFIENIGRYHPLNDPSVIEIDQERALHWHRVGAQPSNQVRNLMEKVGIWGIFVAERPSAAVATTPRSERPAKEKLSKKAQAKAAEGAKAAAAPPAAAPAPAAPADETPVGEVEAPETAETETVSKAEESATEAAQESAEA
jgi:small subunit ribosomal protein S16